MLINKRADSVSQEQALTSPEKPFADETTEQQARHKEIARRFRRKMRRSPKQRLFLNLRKRELERIFADRWGDILPDDDGGRDDLRLMADHLAQLGEHYIKAWTCVWAPWATDGELDTLIVGPGKHWKAADALGKELNLDDATRTRLKIRTIGAVDLSKAQRAKCCRKRKAAAEAARRAKAGAASHASSAARLMPWIEAGMSRRTYYRKRQNGTDGTNSCPILLESQLGTKQCHGGPSPGSGDTLARADEIGDMKLNTADDDRVEISEDRNCCGKEDQRTTLPLNAPCYQIGRVAKTANGATKKPEGFPVPTIDESEKPDSAAPKDRRRAFAIIERYYPNNPYRDAADVAACFNELLLAPRGYAVIPIASKLIKVAHDERAIVPPLKAVLREYIRRCAAGARGAHDGTGALPHQHEATPRSVRAA